MYEYFFKTPLRNFLCMILANFAALLMIPIAGQFENIPIIKVLFFGGLSTLVVFVFMYNNAWAEGFRDVNRVKLGRFAFDRYKGLKCALVNIAPAFFVLALHWIFQTNITFIAAKLFNFYASGFYFIFPHYLTLVMSIIFILNLLLSHIGYNLGYKQISIYRKIAYKEQKQKN